nr:hypothetical protein [Tanacetum cinerariifolium]
EKHSNTESQPPLNRQQTTNTPPDSCRSNHHYTVVAMAAPGGIIFEVSTSILKSVKLSKPINWATTTDDSLLLLPDSWEVSVSAPPLNLFHRYASS